MKNRHLKIRYGTTLMVIGAGLFSLSLTLISADSSAADGAKGWKSFTVFGIIVFVAGILALASALSIRKD